MALDRPIQAPETADGTTARAEAAPAAHGGLEQMSPRLCVGLAGRGQVVNALRRACAALPWIPRAFPPHAERRAGPRARPAPFGRAARFALLALVLGGVLLWSTPAEAQTARVLVSNVGQADDDVALTSGDDFAQLFSTAGATHGYMLTSVIVVSQDSNGDDFDVEICPEDGTADEFPSASGCTALTRPDDFTAGGLEFTHPGLVLSANTNYAVVIDPDGGESLYLDSTTSGGEDATGLTGWSIKDYYYVRSGGNWADESGQNKVLQITVKGYERPADQDATGRPIIFPSAEGAGILLADVSGIGDPNGSAFTNDNGNDDGKGVGWFDFSYQWTRVDGETATETNTGVDSPGYQPVDADIGNLIKVRVSFMDGDGYSETVTSLPFGPLAEPGGPSQPPSTLVGNTGQSASATANITQQYAMGFRLGEHGQGYEISSVSIELDAAPSSLTVSLWIGAPDGYNFGGVAVSKLFDFENPGSFAAGLNKFTAPAGAFAYQNVNYWIVLSGFGSSLSIKETTSDNEDAGGETGAIIFNNASVRALGSTGRWSTSTSRGSVLRLAVEGSRRHSGILASNYAQTGGTQEVVSVGDKGGMPIALGAADRYLIRGFSWLSDDTTARRGGIHSPFDLRSGWTLDSNEHIDSAGDKHFSLTPTRYEAGINVWTAPQGATVAGSGSYLVYEHYTTANRPPGVTLTRFHGTMSDDDDTPTAPGVTLSDAVGSLAGRPLMAVLGEPLDAMVQNLGQSNNGYASLGDSDAQVVSQGFTAGPSAGGYRLQGIGVNIEGSSSSFPDDATSVSVAVHADSGGQPGAKLFDLLSPTEFAAGHSFFEAPPGTTLAASTSYVLVWSHLGGTWHRLQRTSSNAEDSGVLTDFSIANAFYLGADLANMAVDSNSHVLEIAVYGGLPASRVLVSNVRQADDDQALTSGDDFAQLFHTGTTNDYTLTSVIVVSQDSDGDDFDVEVCEADSTANQYPTSTCTALTRPDHFTAGELEFTHDGLALSANTNYVVVIDPDGGENLYLDSTTSGGEDATGLTGWSIKDYFYVRSGGSWADESGQNEVLQITVNGYERAVTPTVTGVALTSTPPNPAYAIGSVVETTVNFSEAVDITGTPQLELDFAGTPKAVDCVAETNTTWMGCYYEVVAGDVAAGGVAIAANKLTLNDGAITATGSTSNNADLDHSAVAANANHKVDGIRPTLVTSGANAPTTSTDGTQVILTFSEPIDTVTPSLITIEGNSVALPTSGGNIVGPTVELTLTNALTDSTASLTVALSADAVDDAVGNGILAVSATTVTNAVVVVAVAPTVSGISLGSDDTYGIGEDVEATVTFSEAVDISGSPQLELDFAGAAKAAACATGTNTSTMVCSYTVLVNDSAPNGVAISANKLSGGTITATGSTTAADLDHSAVAIQAGHKVDGIRPTLVTSGANAPKTSTDGSKVTLRFSEPIGTVTPSLITIEGNSVALPTSGDNIVGPTVELTLTTALTDSATSLTVALAVGAVTDAAGNDNAALAGTTVINNVGSTTTTPTVSSVELTSTTAPYGIGEDVEATVTFSEAVDISGTPQLELDLGGTPNVTKTADCASGTNTTTMVCSYEVESGVKATGGVAIGADKLTLNSGTIYATGSTTTAATLTHSAVPRDSGHKVDGVRPVLITLFADKPTTSADGTKVVLTFTEDVSAADHDKITVKSGATTLTTGAASTNGTRVEIPLSTALTGSDTNITVDLSADAVEDAAGNGNLAVSATAVTNAVVDAPTVSIALTSMPGPDNTYAIEDAVEAYVTFSGRVDITSAPQLELNFDGAAKAAACATGTNTSTMVCSYTVLVNDSAPNGIAIGENKLSGGTITETGSATAAVLTHSPVMIDSGHKVDGIRPALVRTGPNAPTTSTDGAQVILTFEEDISSTVDPNLITIEGNGSVLTTGVASRDVDDNSKLVITLADALTDSTVSLTVALDAGAVLDAARNQNAALAATTVTNAVGGSTVPPPMPEVSSVALTSTPNSRSTYGIGEDIEATVTFSQAVDITGSVQLELDLGGSPKEADCATGTSTTTMVCTYRVLANDSAPDGVAIEANKLSGGTITATGSTTNNADLDHSAVAIQAGHKVDGIRPTLVTTAADAPTTSTDGTKVILTFSEPIGTVTPSLITIEGNSVALPTSGDNIVGPTVELTLTNALTDSTASLTVALAVGAVTDVAGNGNLSGSTTTVSNVVGVANLDPAFPSTEDGLRSVPEDTQAGGNVGALVAAEDPDNDPLDYSLTGTDAASFVIDSDGQLRVATGVQLDYERKQTHSVTVQVSDGKDENGDDDMGAVDARQNVTITVTNVNEPPVVMGVSTASITEHSSFMVASYTATDPEGDKFTWSVDDPTNFWISDRGQLYFRSPPSFEDQEMYTVDVIATDDDVDSPLSGSLSVTITVDNVEEQGVVTISPPRGWADDMTPFIAGLRDDDIVAGSIHWQWSRSPNGSSSWTDIVGETFSSYTATADDANQYLRATASYEDQEDSNKTASATLQTPVGDASPGTNAAPAFSEAEPVARSVQEGTAAGRPVGAPVRANDEDTGDVLTYSLDGTDAQLFDIDPATGQIRTKAVLDYDPDPMADNVYTATVSVHDGFDQSYSSPSTSVDASVAVTITVTAVAQRTTTGGGGGGGLGPAPKFADGFRTTRSVAENARPGNAIGNPVAATHPDDLEITYFLSGTDATSFTVDEETGQIQVKEGVELEVGRIYTVNLTATDSAGFGAIIIVTIEVIEATHHSYDANRNGVIEKDEVLQAVADYFGGRIEKPLVLEVVSLYFAG